MWCSTVADVACAGVRTRALCDNWIIIQKFIGWQGVMCFYLDLLYLSLLSLFLFVLLHFWRFSILYKCFSAPICRSHFIHSDGVVCDTFLLDSCYWFWLWNIQHLLQLKDWMDLFVTNSELLCFLQQLRIAFFFLQSCHLNYEYS